MAAHTKIEWCCPPRWVCVWRCCVLFVRATCKPNLRHLPWRDRWNVVELILDTQLRFARYEQAGVPIAEPLEW